MTKTKVIFSPKHAPLLLFPTSENTFIFPVIQKKTFSLFFTSHMKHSISKSYQLLSSSHSLPVPLGHFSASYCLSSFSWTKAVASCPSANPLVPLQFNLCMVARAMLFKAQGSASVLYSKLSNFLNIQYMAYKAWLNLASGCFSDLICYSHHSLCHTGFCLFFCSSDVPSTLQTQDLCIFKSLCWNVPSLSCHMVCALTLQVSP